MSGLFVHDLDYLCARLHGRRSRVAEGEWLDYLCTLRSLVELAHALSMTGAPESTIAFERRLVEDWISEHFAITTGLWAEGKKLLEWMLLRYEAENLKVLIRGVYAGTSVKVLRQQLMDLPTVFSANWTLITPPLTFPDLINIAPEGPLRVALRDMLGPGKDNFGPFLLQSALDAAYFRELLARSLRLTGEDKEVVNNLIRQEIDIFHWQLVLRGWFFYRIDHKWLLSFLVTNTHLPRRTIRAMLAQQDILTAAGCGLHRVIDRLPGRQKTTAETLAALEALAFTRYLRLANRAFRRSQMGLGVVVGYIVIKRMALANVITLAEGVRLALPSEAIRARLLPRTDLGGDHV